MNELTDDEVMTPAKGEMSDADVMAPPAAPEPTALPAAFLQRLRVGAAFVSAYQRINQAAFGAAKEPLDAMTPTGLSDETLDRAIDAGWFHDPANGKPGPLQFATEALAIPAAQIVQGLFGGINAGLHGGGAALGQLYDELNQPLGGTGEQLRRETINAGNWAMIEAGFGRFVRAQIERPGQRPMPVGPLTYDTPRLPRDLEIGPLPSNQDFRTAADLLGGKDTEENLRAAWEEKGLHPAESFVDAKQDDFLRHDLTQPPTHPADRSGIPPVRGSHIPEGTPRSELARTGDALIDTILEDPETKRAIDNPVVNGGSDVPYSAGPDDTGPGLNIDQHFPRSMTIDGVTFDPADPFAVHEFIEREAMKKLIAGGMKPGPAYSFSHYELAEKAEGGWYASHGIDQAKAEAAYKPHIDAIDHENPVNPPPNLFRKPYPHGRIVGSADVQAPRPTPEEIAQAKEIFSALTEPEAKALSADFTREVPETPPLTPPSRQPLSPAGRLAAAGREAMDQVFGLGTNIQYLLDPMATGSNRAMVAAKDAMNMVRRIRWDHLRYDADAVKRFALERRTRMWDAADEESVSLQLNEPAAAREHQGLATLEPDEREFVDAAQARSQKAWLAARDAGVVEGDGLPAYTPRMVANVGLADDIGPRALNELGRNVFTRTAQMLHRGNLEVEETEAAAKALVAKKMEARGASPKEIEEATAKVQVVRDIRTLLLATARLEEATVWRKMIDGIEDMGKATGQDTVAVGYQPKGWFTIAGNPAFTKWRPEPVLNEVTGKYETRIDDAGQPIMRPYPIYMDPEFQGPMRSILDEGPSRSRLVQSSQSLYGALMVLKGKSMTAILNSPLIHNEVVWSKVAEAVGGREWLGFGLYFRGNRIVNNPGRSAELIERGLAPMGPRGSFQDISGMLEEPNLNPGRSWTAKILRMVPDLFDPYPEVSGGPGDKVAAAIDRAGDFWHNTLLWDRVRDLQFGLADHLSDRLVAKGADRLTADRVATHFANIVIGSIPKEAMSGGARAFANMALFSRSFTLGNASAYKQAGFGLPKPILAQIERDHGFVDEAGVPFEAASEITKTAQSIARRKALSTIGLSVGMYYVGNALLQNALNVAMRDSTVEEEMRGYARRYADFANDVSKDPFELRHLIGRLSPVYANEPQKQDRVYIGDAADGTAIYARNPAGKYGEELIGYPTQPMEMVRRKLSPLAGGLLEALENDKGFGRKIYDENDTTLSGEALNVIRAMTHIAMRHLPEQQIGAVGDLLRGEGDPTVNKLRILGPTAGFTVSVGAPGGKARGEQLSAKSAFESRFNLAWPDIKRQIQRGDTDGARDRLRELGVPPVMMKGLVRNALDPAGALHGRTLHDFYLYATPQQRQRFENAR